MAFALALQSVHDLPDNHGEIIFTATTAIVVLTVSFVPPISYPISSGQVLTAQTNLNHLTFRFSRVVKSTSRNVLGRNDQM
jgi:hypothetical protein